MAKTVQPSISETAFNCPHCSALTSQDWYRIFADRILGDRKIPDLIDESVQEAIMANIQIPSSEKQHLLEQIERHLAGLIVIETSARDSGSRVENLHLSQCYNCGNISVWVHDRLLFPALKAGTSVNQDLPIDIIHDFDEAREIVDASPRGAAALLRLCIQKLCKHLGERGENIDEDIASLVKKGLQPLVQQSLDIVRVIGNEAVHPGELDLKDDRETALRLFELVNAIADQMISHPKSVAEMYAKLPSAKRRAIESRDKK